ncbi:MAG: hypothetical protein AAF911_11910 [Planctomycetota bacterium]
MFLSALLMAEIAGSARGQDAPRWSEVGYGVSLTPPPETVQIEGRAVTWLDPRGFSVSFEIAYSDQSVDLETMTANAMVQMGFAQATPRLLDAQGRPTDKPPLPVRIADRPAVLMYFELDQQDKPDWFYELSNLKREDQLAWFYAQAIVMLEPHAAVIVKLTATRDNQEIGQEAFEQVVASLNVPLASELDEIREARVEKADAWLKSTTPEAWAAALPRDQWYRLIFREKDIGHVRLRSTRDPAELNRIGQEAPGTVAVVDRREYLGEQTLDTRSILYAHDDNEREYWETTTTLRPSAKPRGLAAGGQMQPLTWVHIGIRGTRQVSARNAEGDTVQRNLNVVTIISETPPNADAVRQILNHERFRGDQDAGNIRGHVDENQEWVAPDRSYLSQMQVWTLGKMLPHDEAGVYCFSAYHSDTGKPGLRTVEVRPLDDGGWVVFDRPTSKLSPTRSVYNADGQLVERVTPQGVRLVPTTPEELAEVWGITLK